MKVGRVFQFSRWIGVQKMSGVGGGMRANLELDEDSFGSESDPDGGSV